MLDVPLILHMHDETTRLGHDPALADLSPRDLHLDQPASFLQVATAQHRANFDLWHEEDKARDPHASAAQIADVKHAIDALNQRRNDLVELLDRMLFNAAGPQNPAAPLHSETPGLIIDRLSILALKIFHTAEEAIRPSATEAHREKSRQRLALLNEQRTDLAASLKQLWIEVTSARRRFKLYRQMKMYNDAEQNPVLYQQKLG